MITELSTLKAIPLFSKLLQDESAFLIRSSSTYHCNRGEFIFRHGESLTHFYVICQGAVQIFRETPGGHEVTSDMLIAGDPINAEDIITKQLFYSMNARVIDDATLLKIPVAWMRANIHSFKYVSAHLMGGLSDRLQSAQMEAEHQSTMTATQIVACYLQRLCVLYNFDPMGFELPYSKTLIASRLRMELPTFSRTFRKLKEEGITVNKTRITFTDVQKTARFVCYHCSISEDCLVHEYLHNTPHKNL